MDPAVIQDIYPLTTTQEGMLFHSLAEEKSGVYLVQVGLTLKGNFNKKSFIVAWETLLERHDTLRTAFVWEKVERPLQVVGKKVTLPLHHLDWQQEYIRAGSPSELRSWPAFQKWNKEDRHRDFKLTSAPLLRLTLFHLAPDRFHLVWTYHHLILDGWSLPILLREWMVLYHAANAGQNPHSLLPSAPSFKNYVSWLQNLDKNAAQDYWKNYLSGITETTRLGLPDKGGNTSSTVHYERHLSIELTTKLTELSRTERVTLSTIVQAAWAILLARYGDQEEVVFGLARAGRPTDLPRIEESVGLFINTAPIRISIPTDGNTFEWIRTIQTQRQDQQVFEHLPLIEIHSLSDFPQDRPLFESVVVFENYPQEHYAIPSQSLSFAEVSLQEQTNYPLSLYATVGETLELRLLYPDGRFSNSDILNFVDALEGIFTNFTSPKVKSLSPADHFPPLRPLPLLQGPVPSLATLQRVDENFEAQVLQHPKKIALTFEESSLTYQELALCVEKTASILQSHGIKPGDTVGILLPRSLEMVITLLAVFKNGCHYLPLDPNHPPSRLKFIIADADMNALVVNTDTVLYDPAVEVLINLSESSSPSKFTPVPVSLSETAYLIYTSGTTGQPKGVPITHLNLANLLQSFQTRLDFGPENNLLAVTTLAFDISGLELFLPLTTGGTVVLANEEDVRDGERLIALSETHQIDTLQATPSGWQTILPHWNQRLASRAENFTILCGGEALDPDLAHRLVATHANVWNVYGPTETTIWSGALKLTEANLSDGIVPIGGALDHTEFHLLDSKLRPTPSGVYGELAISGSGLSPGYHQKETLTAERFQLHGKTLVYRTGDRARYRPDGTLEFLGRLDHQIKLRGHRIELAEIEMVLQAHPTISQAIVVLQDEKSTAAHILAIIKGKKIDAPELRDYLLAHLPAYMLPTRYHQVEKFPLTPNGKIDRQALTALEIKQEKKPNTPPKTELERQLADIWSRLLKTESPGRYDNFFEMGGHSLLVLKARNEIRDSLGIHLALADFFRHPTLHALADHIFNTNPADSPGNNRDKALNAGKSRLQQRRQRRLSQKPSSSA